MRDWRGEIRKRLAEARLAPAREAEIVEELAAHLEDRVADLRAAGATPEHADETALAELDSSELLARELEAAVQSLAREPAVAGAPRTSLLADLWYDLRYGCRMLLKTRALTGVAVATLALGIGANTAVFTLLNALLLRTLPVPKPHELVVLNARTRGGFGFISFPMYRDLRANQTVFTGMFASAGETPVRLGIHGDSGTVEVDNVRTSFVTASYFPVLGVQPALGRFFTEDEDRRASSSRREGSVAVLSHAFWERQFGRDPGVLDRTIVIQRSTCRVIGVASPGFFGEVVGQSPDVWVPLVAFSSVDNLENRRGTFTVHVARLRPGVSRDQAQGAMTVLFRRLIEDERRLSPESAPRSAPEGAYGNLASRRNARGAADASDHALALDAGATGVTFELRRTYAKPLRILMGIVALVLLIACANVANLLLARGAARRREIGVRLVLGCDRGRLVRQLLTESVLLSSFGTLAGLALAWAGTRLLVRMLGAGKLDLAPDAAVLGFTVAVMLVAGLGFGSAPAWRASAVDVASALKDHGRAATDGRTRQYLGRTLVVAQVALSLLLLIGAGLLVRSLQNLRRIELGFRPEQVLVFSLGGSPESFEPAALSAVARRVHERVRRVPAVMSASLSGLMLFGPSDISTSVRLRDGALPPEQSVPIRFSSVSPGFFATVGMRLLEGRDFDDHDALDAPLVAVVNQTMARRYLDGKPLGRVMEIRNKAVRIVGVIADAKYNDLRAEVKPMLYMPIQQVPRSLRSLEVRTTEPAAALLEPIRRAVREATPDVMIRDVFPLSAAVDRTFAAERLVTTLGSFFGVLALLLASVGLYGVISYGVAQRTGEIGVRMAFGATRRDVLWMVLRQSLTVVLAGILLGIPAALAATRLVSTFLYGLSPTDPSTIVFATLLLLAVASCAALVPARRATRVDPMVALRHE